MIVYFNVTVDNSTNTVITLITFASLNGTGGSAAAAAAVSSDSVLDGLSYNNQAILRLKEIGYFQLLLLIMQELLYLAQQLR